MTTSLFARAKILLIGLGAFALLSAAPASAEIKIGLVSSATGPGAAMGIPYRNTLALLPTTIGGESVKYIFMDDASDPTQGMRSVQRLVTEEKVDAIIGSNSMPVTLAVVDATAAAKVPFLVVSPAKFSGESLRWSFPLPQTMDLMVKGIIADMKAKKVKTVGYIGFSDSWGDVVLASLKNQTQGSDIQILTNERYARTDTTVKSQALKLLSAKPDVVIIGASSSAAVLPETSLRDMGYKGQIYQTHAAVTADFIRLGGKSVEGSIAPTGPLTLAASLDDRNPMKAKALDLKQRYEEKYGSGSFNPFVGYVWDAGEILSATLPKALQHAKPGTEAFRTALRDAIENVNGLVGTQGVYTMSPTDHNGLDDRARIMIQVRDGRWQVL